MTQAIKAGGVPAAGEIVVIEARPQQREALAKLGNLDGIESLKAELNVKPRGKELRVRGKIFADVVYTCVRSLEPFTHHLEEKVDVSFASPQAQAKNVDLSFGDDMPEELVDGQARLGALVQELFLLALDPYPHKPDAAFEDSEAAVVASLKQT
ncbi:MAG: DUF177 domain-containing protein [Pseudomonadota bacterium]